MSRLSRLPKPMVLDGAVGTELMRLGFQPGRECPELWNRERPDVLRALHKAYFDAGAHAVQTNTFGGTRLRLRALAPGLSPADVRAVNVAGALLAREVRPVGCLVIGSLGPTGLLPPPQGKADLFELEDAFAEQAQALAEGGVDLLHLETLYHPKEARAALRGVRLGAPGLPVVASMTCRRGHGPSASAAALSTYATPLGFTAEIMLQTFLEERVDGVGVNCTLLPAQMLDLVLALRQRTTLVGALPIFAKPTPAPDGMPRISADDLGAGALALLAAGARAVGGCCGAGPAEVAAIAGKLVEAAESLTL